MEGDDAVGADDEADAVEGAVLEIAEASGVEGAAGVEGEADRGCGGGADVEGGAGPVGEAWEGVAEAVAGEDEVADGGAGLVGDEDDGAPAASGRGGEGECEEEARGEVHEVRGAGSGERGAIA